MAEWRAREKGRAASYLSYSSCLDRRLAMKKESRNVLIVVAVFVLSIALISLIDSLVIVYYAHLMGSTLEDASIATTKTVLIVNELLLGSLAVFFFTKIFKRRLVELGITTTRFARNIVIGLLLGAGGWLVAVIVATLAPKVDSIRGSRVVRKNAYGNIFSGSPVLCIDHMDSCRTMRRTILQRVRSGNIYSLEGPIRGHHGGSYPFWAGAFQPTSMVPNDSVGASGAHLWNCLCEAKKFGSRVSGAFPQRYNRFRAGIPGQVEKEGTCLIRPKTFSKPQ